MKIYTHWVYDPDEEQHTKGFFATKTERETASKISRNEGKQVVAEFEWLVEPTAKDFAAFCQDHLKLREYKDTPDESLGRYDEELPKPKNLEDALGDFL